MKKEEQTTEEFIKKEFEILAKAEKYLKKAFENVDYPLVINFLEHLKIDYLGHEKFMNERLEEINNEISIIYDTGAKSEKCIDERFKGLDKEIDKLKSKKELKKKGRKKQK